MENTNTVTDPVDCPTVEIISIGITWHLIHISWVRTAHKA